jgi:hypothetical protein
VLTTLVLGNDERRNIMEDKMMNQNEEIITETEDTTVVEPEVETETEDEIVTEPEVETAIGIVSGCKNLNIRKRPVVNPNNVLCIVPEGTPLIIIDPEKATKEWYKVELEDDTKGFCMKEYVTVNE